MLAAGSFRQDLYYRLNIFHLHTPPLREIRRDIPRMAYRILSSLRTGKRVLPAKISPEVMQLLMSYDWPGNVRELRNILERAAAVAGGEPLREEHLPPDFLENLGHAFRGSGTPPNLKRALEYTGGNRTQAAELLGIHRTGIHQKMKKYGLE
jgi:DNA-binding NtrC family response regulator